MSRLFAKKTMIKAKLKLILSGIGLSLLLLSACSTPTEQKSSDSEASSPTSAGSQIQGAIEQTKQTTEKMKGAVTDVVALKGQLTEMQSSLSQTISAVKAGDFTTAKQEFGKLQNHWNSMEGTVKTKSAETHTAINDSINKIRPLLQAEKPESAPILEALNNLTKSLKGISF